jgi:hypothetical protein
MTLQSQDRMRYELSVAPFRGHAAFHRFRGEADIVTAFMSTQPGSCFMECIDCGGRKYVSMTRLFARARLASEMRELGRITAQRDEFATERLI